MARNNRGTGSIYYREDRKVYEGKIKVGTKFNGKPIYKYVTRKRQKGVADELVRIKSQIIEGGYIEPSKAKVIDWLLEWLEVYMRNSIKEQTYNTYKMVIEKMLFPLLRDVKLKGLTPIMMQNAFNLLSKKYSAATVRKIKNILNSALSVARQNDLMVKDPLIGIKLPKLQKPKI